MAVNQKVVCHTQAELDAAYQAMSKGEGGEILLASGVTFQFRAWDLDQSRNEAPVTIRSLDPNAPAKMEMVRLNGIDNVTFEDFSLHMGNDSPYGASGMIDLNNCSGITVRNCEMTGAAGGPPGTVEEHEVAANAAVVRNSEEIVFEGNEISGLNQGLAFLDCRDVTVKNNDIQKMQGDGIRIGGVEGMEVAGNYIHDLIGSEYDFNHADMIQLWGTGTTITNKDILIKENVLDTGNGAQYQMIFGHNEEFGDNGRYFENIEIEGNVLFGSHYHSISINHTKDAVVRNNTVLYNKSVYSVEEDGTFTSVSEAGAIDIRGTGAVVEDNIARTVQNAGTNQLLETGGSQENDYRSHFINVEAGGDGDLRDLMLRPDSPLNGVAGSRLTWATAEADSLTAVADVTVSDFDHSLVTLSAEFSRGPDGYAAGNGAKFLWIFADGTTRSGAVVEHDFETAGRHEYTLVATLPDGSRDIISRSIEIESPHVFDLTFPGQEWADSADGEAGITLADGASVQDGWLEIGGRSRLEVSRSTEGLFNLDGFNLGITIERESGAEGTFLELPRSLSASIDAEGHVRFTLTTDEGEFTLISGEAIFADEQPHQLNFVYDGKLGSLALIADGQLSDTIGAHGTTNPELYWGMTIGRPWGEALPARVKDVYFLNESISRDGRQPYDFSAEAEPSFLGYLFWDASGVEAIDLDYSLSGPGPWTPEGINISENQLTLTRQNDVFYEAEAFSLSFDLQLNEAGGHGTVVYLHDTLELTLNEAGQLVLRLNTSEGWEQIATAPAAWDEEVHSISIAYDGAENSLQLIVDGTLAASGTHSGETPEIKYWGVSFGHPWADSSLDAMVNYISVSSAGEIQDGAPGAGSTYDFAAHDLSGESVLAFDFEGGQLADLSGGGATVDTPEGNLVFSEERGSQVLQVTSGTAAAEVSREYDALYEQDDFVFALDLKSESENGRSVFGVHKAFRLDVADDDLVFRMTTSEGQFEVATDGDVLADRGWHAVEISYSDSLGVLQISVDGVLADTVAAGGQTPEREYWGLDLGSKWGRGFEGQIDDFAFMTDVNADHFDLF